MPNIIEMGQAKKKLDVAHIIAASEAVQTAAYLMGASLSIETLGSGTTLESNGCIAR
jgi:hypothetical protein